MKTGSGINSKPDYRFRLAFAALILITPFFFWGGPDDYSARAVKEIWNTGHIFYFALATWLLLKWKYVSRQSFGRQVMVILFILLVAGTLIELLQSGLQRTPDINDVLRDMTGSVLVLLFIASRAQKVSRPGRAVLQATALIILFIQFWPLAVILIDDAISSERFPVLSDFESPFEGGRWSGSALRVIEKSPDGTTGDAMRITFSTAKFSSVDLKYFHGDWRGYSYLKFSFFYPGKRSTSIVCRIHDLEHLQGKQQYEDRYNQAFLLRPGWNRISINLKVVASSPRNRKMDMKQIRGAGFFTMSLPSSQTLYLDDVRLSH
ncbi:MAG TPA: hypothetical protein ENI65_03925 [Gammaproteobacteria bacterium]|nr:hypothetical protein [Gammaproteobacteria bacterium]